MTMPCDFCTLSIPLVDLETEPTCYALFKRAPMFLLDASGTIAHAVFPHLSQSSAQVQELVASLVTCPAGAVYVNGRPVKNLQALSAMLQCYGKSVAWGDPASFCRTMRAFPERPEALPDGVDGGDCPFACLVVESAGVPASDAAAACRTQQACKGLAMFNVCPNAAALSSQVTPTGDGGGV